MICKRRATTAVTMAVAVVLTAWAVEGARPASAASAAPERATAGMNISEVDVCALLPIGEVESIVGKRRYKPPKRFNPIGQETGCKYVSADKGHFYEAALYPAGQWNLMKATLAKAKPVDAGGAAAHVGTYSDAIWLIVLAEGRCVISVRSSDKNLDRAVALYRLARGSLGGK